MTADDRDQDLPMVGIDFRCQVCGGWLGRAQIWNGDPDATGPDGRRRADDMHVRALDMPGYLAALSPYGRLTFPCPRCRARPQVNRDRLVRRLADLAAEAGPGVAADFRYLI